MILIKLVIVVTAFYQRIPKVAIFSPLLDIATWQFRF